MCPLVVESSISSSPLPLAVNDRQSQSHQLDSTSSTGNRVPLFYKHTVHNVDRNIHIKHTHICLWTETFRADHLSNWHGCQKTLNYWLFFMLSRQKSTQHHVSSKWGYNLSWLCTPATQDCHHDWYKGQDKGQVSKRNLWARQTWTTLLNFERKVTPV